MKKVLMSAVIAGFLTLIEYTGCAAFSLGGEITSWTGISNAVYSNGKGKAVTAGMSKPSETAVMNKGLLSDFDLSIKALSGGPGISAGAEYKFYNSFRIGAYGGAVYMDNIIIPAAEIGLSWNFFNIEEFGFRAAAGGFCYFVSPLIVSPMVRAEADWNSFFIEGGIRYGIKDGVIYPLVGIGFRF